MSEDYYRTCAIPKPEPRCLTKRRRAKTDAQAERACRAAVRRRDKGHCQIPGCKDAARAQHHVVYRSRSKRLKFAPENLASLCVDHHQLVHAGVIHLAREADGELIVTGDIDRLKFRL